ncbi:MAG TPA: hypothetical protein VKX28_13480 [Xanthobacteraceae bacterium]|nr:hypothetical protein [Xanthobacteraceae bacterium]
MQVSASPAKVARDRAWIEREFGRDKWGAVLERIRGLREAGETNLARAVATLNADEAEGAGRETTDIVLGGRRVAAPARFAYTGFYALVRTILLDHCAAIDPDLIVELGAGWGRNLFDLWLGGSPRAARYAALEFTGAGRDATRALADLDSDLRMEIHPFDYYATDAMPLAAGRRVVAFTVFSVDQIPHLPPPAIERILRLGGDVWGIHFEPFGWQWRAERGDAGRVGSSADYAASHDYNRDFWPVMRSFEQSGAIAIEQVEPELYGANPENAASLLCWRKVGQT